MRNEGSPFSGAKECGSGSVVPIEPRKAAMGSTRWHPDSCGPSAFLGESPRRPRSPVSRRQAGLGRIPRNDTIAATWPVGGSAFNMLAADGAMSDVRLRQGLCDNRVDKSRRKARNVVTERAANRTGTDNVAPATSLSYRGRLHSSVSVSSRRHTRRSICRGIVSPIAGRSGRFGDSLRVWTIPQIQRESKQTGMAGNQPPDVCDRHAGGTLAG